MYEILEKIENSYPEQEVETLKKAYFFAKDAHANQKRASGEAYFTHPCAVAKILVDLGLDCSTICAAFLHDVIEDTPVSSGDIEKEFGKEVLNLVLGVTKLDKIEFNSVQEEQAENFKKIFVSMADDIRVIIIKLADRLHNMRSLNFLSEQRQQRMAHETIEIYAPLAGRLGISQIKCELEDLCLKYIDPDAYEYLSVNINSKISERREFVKKVVEEDSKFTITINHSNSFKTVISDVDYVYTTSGEQVFAYIPVCYVAGDSAKVYMYDGENLLTNYIVEDGVIIWES